MAQYARQRDYESWRVEAELQGQARRGPYPSGWTAFSSIVLAMAGAFGAISGAIALFHEEAFLIGEEQIVAFDLTRWGWIHLVGGLVVVAAAMALASGAVWARIIGVTVAFFHALSQVAFIEAYPFWSLTIIALDVLVIYGCLVHGREMEYGR